MSVFLPLPDISYPQKILAGLGKATKRGVKKCFNCGVYNGTRSVMCRNKKCGVLLKDSEEKRKLNVDAVKLLTGTKRQVYSVKVRDKGPHYRGFVQLPLLQSHSNEGSIFSEVALCFVESCQNSFDNSILKCHEEDQNDSQILCVHIKCALKSQNSATPIEFKDHILQSLKIAKDIKAKLHLLATEKEGPLVQRVSKSVMAVKCQVTPKHPLGYLHFTFIKGKGKDCYEKYYCSCTGLIVSNANTDNTNYKCIHYYSCIWALASSSKYIDEFSNFISCELPITSSMATAMPTANDSDNSRSTILTKTHPIKKDVSYSSKHNTTKPKKKYKRPSRESYSLKRCRRIMPKVLPIEIKVINELKDTGNEDESWNFFDWLSYVTESINRTMQFDNCGILNTLAFHIPEKFYECFKKRIPSVYEEIQNDASCTYNIMNILHLKEIFDTPQIKLKISKKFIHNEQKGYVEYDENEENSESYQCPFIFFLNVGQSTVDESDNTNNPFIIKWLISVTNLTRVGQLTLQYKYGRKST
ncbi:hypothetical protein NQ317_013357 [Molorchus minor]|uniref:Putative treble-clef zinc-finger domain-containing protein n=1 Tax=Molorchus minor TaxID=1323400 RepID=A0ABQ9JL39_9CUCU|nr:hypothetical protein NQ317_013357 [Molorchus minor]